MICFYNQGKFQIINEETKKNVLTCLQPCDPF